MRLSEMKPFDELLSDRLRDPDFREAWDQTALARAIADQVISYRAEHGLTQTELGRQLGLRQPTIARLEAGDHEPSLSTLAALSRKLGIAFRIEITPDALKLIAQGVE